ncbi:hypothetical protein [Streptomyces sp. cg2]|uniref:hypothetical protein n=1 Tax=Streptomyces sp. cg2 TaxID=3238799 RepID=UPI0034E25A08
MGQSDASTVFPQVERLVARSGDLKSELVAFAQGPRFARRMGRHPGGADAVFRTLLRKPAFTWERDGEALLRRRKKRHYGREPLPSVTPVGTRLAELVRSGRRPRRS